MLKSEQILIENLKIAIKNMLQWSNNARNV